MQNKPIKGCYPLNNLSIMDFVVLFALVTSLSSFSIKYKVDPEKLEEDYFSFSGNQSQSSAYLHRVNGTIKLHISTLTGFEHYNMDNVTGEFEFIWRGFKINNTPMNLTQTKGNVNDLMFDMFLFISPIIDHLDSVLEPTATPIYQISDVNYNIILAIAFCVGFVFRSDSFVALFHKFYTKFRKEEYRPTESETL